MVFGINPTEWQPRYAWKPVKLIDGRWAWLEWVEITGFVENPEIEPHTPFNCRIFSTSFCARLVRPQDPAPSEIEGWRP